MGEHLADPSSANGFAFATKFAPTVLASPDTATGQLPVGSLDDARRSVTISHVRQRRLLVGYQLSMPGSNGSRKKLSLGSRQTAWPKDSERSGLHPGSPPIAIGSLP